MIKFLISGVFLLVFAGSSATAQTTHEAERKELLGMLKVFEDSINNKDMSAIESMIRPNTVMVFQDATIATGPDQIDSYFDRTIGAADSLISDINVKAEVGAPAEFYGGNMAVAFGNLVANYGLRAGKAISLNTVWTTTIVKEDDAWRIASLHFSNNIFDNPILNASKKIGWVYGVVGLILGLLLMWLISRFTSRARRT